MKRLRFHGGCHRHRGYGLYHSCAGYDWDSAEKRILSRVMESSGTAFRGFQFRITHEFMKLITGSIASHVRSIAKVPMTGMA